MSLGNSKLPDITNRTAMGDIVEEEKPVKKTQVIDEESGQKDPNGITYQPVSEFEKSGNQSISEDVLLAKNDQPPSKGSLAKRIVTN